MDLLATLEQEQIQTAVRDFLESEMPLASRRGAETHTGDDFWAKLAGLGVFGLSLPVEQGGAGYGGAEQFLVHFELSRHLTPGPYMSTALAAELVARHGLDGLLRSIVEGEARVGLAEPVDRCHALDGLGDAGQRFRVHDGADADLLLVVGRDGTALVQVSTGTVDPSSPFDPLSTVGVIDGSALTTLVSEIGDRVWATGTLLTAAAMTGLAQGALDASVDYTKVREQFGKPIGTFQAVKHRCADMAMRAEACHSLTAYAALSLQGGMPDAAYQVSAARVVAADAAIRNARDDIQNHGGMGFTTEVSSHLFLRQGLRLDRTFGRSESHLAHLREADSPQ